MQFDDSTMRVMADVEAKRSEANVHGEEKLSIGDWIDRIKHSTVQTMAHARSGDVQGEYDRWVEVMDIACGRAEILLKLLDEQRSER